VSWEVAKAYLREGLGDVGYHLQNRFSPCVIIVTGTEGKIREEEGNIERE